MRGVKVKPNHFATSLGNHVCLCGAVLHAVNGPISGIEQMNGVQIIKAVAKKLGITYDQAISLNNGFEGRPITDLVARGAEWDEDFERFLAKRIDKTWYTTGKSLRRQYEKATA